MEPVTHCLVIPVYRNEDSIAELIEAVSGISRSLRGELLTVFVVDGSPDRSWEMLSSLLPKAGLKARLVLLSRNFGSFSAIRAGLEAVAAENYAVMAADLQDPPSVIEKFFAQLSTGDSDVIVGVRERRDDPLLSRTASRLFWAMYRRLVVPEMPPGGVDIFGCNRRFRDELLGLRESHSSLVAMIFWLGFRRSTVSYSRNARRHGRSAWTFSRKVKYLMDSVFAFTDLPIKLLMFIGALGIAASGLLGAVTMVARLTGYIAVPGYAATIFVIAFFGALNIFGLGLIGSYAWRAYENSKARPLAISHRVVEFEPPSQMVTH
jgi:glycosyltransferase involved in cell wall biosynthesis